MRIKGPNVLTFDMPEEQAKALLRDSGFEAVGEKVPAKPAAKTTGKVPAKPADAE